MTDKPARMRQVVDWGAAVWAGLLAGLVFLLLNLLLTPAIEGGNAWVMLRLMASVALGQDVVAPPATFDATVFIVALISHFTLSVGFALLVALALHRWGLIVGVLGGALFGVALYCVNFYTLTFFFPWFWAMKSWTLAASHVIFGALAGGIYELLEIEEFVPVEAG